jgi:biotin carboxylase
MQGPEVSVEVIALDGEPNILQVTDKLTTGAPHFVEMGHSQPSRLEKSDLEKIRDLSKRAVKAVGIKNGPAHVEIILTENGPKMVELGARMGGDCITTHLVPLSTGIDMIEATIRIACGEKPDITPKFEKGSAIRFLEAPHGTITAIEGIDEAEKIDGVREISFTKGIGDTVGDIGSSTDRVGFVIAQADDVISAVEICKNVCKKLGISTKTI